VRTRILPAITLAAVIGLAPILTGCEWNAGRDQAFGECRLDLQRYSIGKSEPDIYKRDFISGNYMQDCMEAKGWVVKRHAFDTNESRLLYKGLYMSKALRDLERSLGMEYGVLTGDTGG
jgi:hypothetical protein